MKNLEKIILGIVLGSSLFIVGCGTMVGGERNPNKDFVTIPHHLTTLLTQSSTRVPRYPKNPDELLSNLNQNDIQIQEGNIKKRYNEELRLIENYVRDKQYYEVREKVLSLADELKWKDDRISQELLEDLKEFTYIRYEYIEAKYREGKRLTGDITVYPLAILTGLFGDFDGAKREVLVDMERKKVEEEHYRAICVNPYRKEEEIIKEFVPVDEVR